MVFTVSALIPATTPSAPVKSEKEPTVEQRCEAGDLIACMRVTMKQNLPPTIKPLKRLLSECEGGNYGSCNDAGMVMLINDSTEMAQKEARRLFDKACLKISAGCNNIGVMWEYGAGGEKNFATARRISDQRNTERALRGERRDQLCAKRNSVHATKSVQFSGAPDREKV